MILNRFFCLKLLSSSLWGCELKYWRSSQRDQQGRSSSLWGCELKYNYRGKWNRKNSHPPCEDVSWNNINTKNIRKNRRHPPCEDVSWNMNEKYMSASLIGHPPCEDVSWNLSILLVYGFSHSHPPCEDVSWNASTTIQRINSQNVILLVRMWVEILMLQS